MRKTLTLVLAGILAFGSAGVLADEPYPSKPLRIIVQFGAGTSTDIVARIVGQKLSQSLGQSVVIENKVGAGGILGTELAAKSKPDGYTIVMAVSSVFGIDPTLYAKLPFDVLKDFIPITMLVTVPQTLVVPEDGPDTVRELVERARARPGQIAYASLGVGSTNQLTTVMFASAVGIELIHVPFKGSAEAATQVIGGAVPMMFDALPAVLTGVRAGKLKALALSSNKRSSLLPNVPTLAESGYPGIEALGWIGMAAPAGTPMPVIERLNRDIAAILNDPEVKPKLEEMGFTTLGDTPQASRKFIEDEIVKWGKAVRDSGAKVE